MKEHPLLCKAPEVRAILEGRQTQVRLPIRLRDFRKSDTPGYDFCFRDRRGCWNDVRLAEMLDPPRPKFPGRCPYGGPGDVLWVRESFRVSYSRCGLTGISPIIVYRAGGLCSCGCDDTSTHCGTFYKWRPSIHMPRRSSRLFLRVTDVRVQRVRDISEEDAFAEGITQNLSYCISPRDAFGALWDECYGPGAWDRNDWVWALTFERMED